MLTEYEQRLSARAIKRKNLFLILSLVSVGVGLGLTVFYSWEAYTQPNFDAGIHFVLVIMILLNARQNLRQYNYAKILAAINSTTHFSTN